VTRIAIALIVIVAALRPAGADDRKAAERYFKAGAKAFAAQSFEAAATNFDEAYKALPMPEIAFSAAQAYRKAYQVEAKPEFVKRAVELYEFYLSKVKSGGRVGDAAHNHAQMKRELDRLGAAGIKTSSTAAPKTRLGINVSAADQAASDIGTLREIGDPAVDTAIKGLTATVDRKPVEPFSLVEVDAKEHVIAVAADGYFPVEKKTVAVEGQSTLVDVELKPKPAKLTVKTEGDAKILVDGRTVATTPSGPVDLPQGKHLLAVLRNGREPFAQEVALNRGQDLAVNAELHKTGRRKAVPWIFGGAGLLAAGAVTTAIVAHSRNSHAEDLQQMIEMGNQPPSVADDYDSTIKSRDKLVTWTWILGGAAVAAAGTGTLLLVFDTPTADSATIGVAGRF
jgi:hypothetical protein